MNYRNSRLIWAGSDSLPSLEAIHFWGTSWSNCKVVLRIEISLSSHTCPTAPLGNWKSSSDVILLFWHPPVYASPCHHVSPGREGNTADNRSTIFVAVQDDPAVIEDGNDARKIIDGGSCPVQGHKVGFTSKIFISHACLYMRKETRPAAIVQYQTSRRKRLKVVESE